MADNKFVNPVTYLKNVTKSITYSTLDITKEMLPAGSDLLETNEDILKEVIKTVRTPRKSVGKLNAFLKGSKVYEAGELAVKATMEDIRTGNFYNKQRIDEINSRAAGTGGLLDFDGLDIDFDQLDADIASSNMDDEEDKVTKGDKFVGEIVSESSFAASEAVSKSVMASGQYVAQTNRASSMLMYNLNVKGFEIIGRGVGSVNENVAKLVNFSNVTIKDFMEKTLQQHDKMLKLQEEQTVLLKQIHDMQAALQPEPEKEKTPKANRYGDVMSGGTFDIKEYAKLVGNNIINETPLKSLKDMGNAMGGEDGNILLTFASSPLKFVSDILIKKAIPDFLDKSITQFNNTLSGFFGTLLYRLTNADEEDSFLGGWIKKIFGVKNNIKSGINTSEYQKGPIPFDGITKKAITETIPGYLARIEAAITGGDERHFDYDKGTFRNREEVEREYSNLRKQSVERATGDMKNSIKRQAIQGGRIDFSDATNIEYFNKDLEKFFEDLYNGKKFFDPTNDKLTGSDFGISDENFMLIRQLFRESDRNLQTSIYPGIMEAREQLNRTMEDLSKKGDSVFNNIANSDSLNRYDSKTGRMLDSKFGLGNLNNQKDKYGKTIFNWLEYQSLKLVEIANNTSLFGSRRSTEEHRISNPNLPRNNHKASGTNSGFSAADVLRGDLNLEEQETTSQRLRKQQQNEYDKFLRDNNKAVGKLRDKGYKVFSVEDFGNMDEDNRSSYMAELQSNIKTINSLEQDKEEPKKNQPKFIQKLKGYIERPASFIEKIFNRADERLYTLMFGDPEKGFTIKTKSGERSIIEVAKEKFDWLVNEISEKFEKIFNPIFDKLNQIIQPIFEKIKDKASPILENIKNAAKPAMESAKDAFKSTGKWLSDGFKETFSPVKNLFKADGTWGTTKKVENIDDVDMLADGTRMMDKTGLAILSEGEMVIPQRLNPFYKGKRTPVEQQKRNEKLVKNNLISKFASNVAKDIPLYNEGTTNAKPKKVYEDDPQYMQVDGKWYNFETEQEVSKEEVDQYNIIPKSVGQAAIETTTNGFKNLFGELRTIFIGSDEKKGGVNFKQKLEDSSSELFKEALGDLKGNKAGYVGKGLAGGAIGIGASLLTGGLVSPMIAAALGSATSIVLNSEKTRNWLFGTEDEEGNFKEGVLPKKLVDGITKYVPSMAKHGTIGAITALLPFVPGGPVAGLMVGSAVGFMKENESVQNWLFGEEGLFGGKSKDEVTAIIKKKLPNILGGAGLGAAAGFVFGGPFGLVGNALLGGSLGFLSTTDKFKEVLFGKTDENGNRTEDGLVQKLGKWAKRNIVDQLKDFIKPFSNRLIRLLDRTGKMASGFFARKFEEWVGIPLSRALSEYVLKPMKKIASPFLKAGKALVKVATSPFHLLGGIGRKMQRTDLKKGNSAYLGNASERLKRREELGMGNDDFYGQIDKAIKDMSIDELMETSSLINKTHDERIENRKNRVNARKVLQRNLSDEMGGDFKIKDIKKISKLIKDGKSEEAAKLIQSGSIIPIGQKSRFANAENTEEIMNIFNDYGTKFKEATEHDNEYERKLRKALVKQFGDKNPIVDKLMKGDSASLLRILNKEASSRPKEEVEKEKEKGEENKFRDSLLDKIEDIRRVMTGEAKPAAEEAVDKIPNAPESEKAEEEKTTTDKVAEAAETVSEPKKGKKKRKSKKKKAKPETAEKKEESSESNGAIEKLAEAASVITNPEEKAKMDEDVEKKTKTRYTLTPDGLMKWVRGSDGTMKPDKRDKATKATMKDEDNEDKNLFKISSFTEKISNFIGRNKNDDEEEDEEGGILKKGLSWIKSKAGGLLKTALAASGIITALGATTAATGYVSEAISQSDIGSGVKTWLFGGTDDDGNQKEGVVTKLGKALAENLPRLSEIIIDTVGNAIINGANYITTNSEKVGKWIENGINLFTENIINLLNAVPAVVEALSKAVTHVVPALAGAIIANIPAAIKAIGEVAPEVGTAVGQAIGTVARQIPSILLTLLQSAGDILPEIGTALKNSVIGLIKGIFGIDIGTKDNIPVFDSNGNIVAEVDSDQSKKNIPIVNKLPDIGSSENSLPSFGNITSDTLSKEENGTSSDSTPTTSSNYVKSQISSTASEVSNTTSNTYKSTSSNTSSKEENDTSSSSTSSTSSNKVESKISSTASKVSSTTTSSSASTSTSEEEETYTYGVQDEEGNIEYIEIKPGEDGYEEVKAYYDAQELANSEVKDSFKKEPEAYILSTAQAARLGLLRTKRGKKILSKFAEKLAKTNPDAAKIITNNIDNKTLAAKITKIVDTPNALALKAGAKIATAPVKLAGLKRKRKQIMKQAKKDAAEFTVKGQMKNAVKESSAGKAISQAKADVKTGLKGKVEKTTSKVKDFTKKRIETVKTNIAKLFNKLINTKMIKKYLKGCGSACDKLLDNILVRAGKAAAKAGVKLAAGLLSGGLFNALLATYKFIDGMANAEGYLKVESATLGQKVICGFAVALNEFVLFGLLPEEWIINAVLTTVGKSLGIDKEIETQREELKKETEIYNSENGTSYTVDDYNKKVLDNKTGFSGIASKLKNAWNKITGNSGSGTVSVSEETNKKSGSGSGMGSFISSLISSVDPNSEDPILSQLDSRISNKKFGNSTVGESGCAPSAAAIYLNRPENSIDINDTMKSAVKYQNPDGSVRSDYFKDIFSKYGYSTKYTDNKSDVLSKLKDGQKLILLGQDENNNSKVNSPFGSNSHYVVASGLNNGKVTIADPETTTQVAYDKSILDKVQLAVSAKNNKSGSGSRVSSMNYYYYSGSGGLTSAQIKKNKDAIFTYIVSEMGLSKGAAVGVMANIKQECGFNPGLQEVTPNVNKGYGICQWTGGRRTNLEKYAKNHNSKSSDLDMQLKFFDQEIKKYTGTYNKLKKTKDSLSSAKDAAEYFCRHFEIPADVELRVSQRRGFCEDLWDEYKDFKVTGYVASDHISSLSDDDDSSSSSSSTSDLFSGLVTDLMKNVYGEDVLSLFGLSSSDSSSSSSDDSDSSSSNVETISSNAKTATKFFTETLKGTLTSPYGYRNHPISGKNQMHRGIDIGADGKTKIYTPVSGTVTRSDGVNKGGSYGNLLVIKDNDGHYHYFAHQYKKPSLSVGDKVKKGQQVGLVGTTGSSTGNHLHYEIRDTDNNNPVNPDTYLKSYYKKGGSGSNLISPYQNIDKTEFDPSGPKGGGGTETSALDIDILESLVSVISKILIDTNNIGQIKDLLSEYLTIDKNSAKKTETGTAKSSTNGSKSSSQINIIKTSDSNNTNVDERKAVILSQLKELIAQ